MTRGSGALLLSIDPSSAVTGIAVVNIQRSPDLVYHGKLKMQGDVSPSAVVKTILDLYPGQVMYAVIEDQYLGKNPDSMKKVTRAGGRWEEACEVEKLKVYWVLASVWQGKVLRGMGRDRAQLKKASRILAQAESGVKLTTDEADAYLMGRYTATMMSMNLWEF